MSDLGEVFKAIEEAAGRYGWSVALANQRQAEPEQHEIIITRQDPAQALFKTLGIRASDGLQTGDVFGGGDG